MFVPPPSRAPRTRPDCHRRARAGAKRRGVLQGQEHHDRDRLHARRRLRSLCATSGAPHGQTHSGPADASSRRTWPAPGVSAPPTSSIPPRPRTAPRFGTFARTTGINPLLESGATFDGTKFTWLGSVTNDTSLCVTWHTSKANNWENFLKYPTNMGGQAQSAEPDIFANLYKNVFGAPIKLVPGYPGTNEITLAMERGEVDGLCGLSWSTIQTRHLQWLRRRRST